MRRSVLGPMPCVGWGAKSGGAAPAPYVGTKAASLDGVDEYLTGPSLTLNANTGYAVSFWSKRNDAVGSEYVWSVRQSGAVVAYSWWTAAGVLFSAVPGASGSCTAVTVGNWAQFLVVVDKNGSNVRIKVYRNGTLDVTHEGSTANESLTATLNVGRLSTGVNFLNGSVCDLALWGAGMDGADATNLYNGGARGNPETLTGKTAARLWAFTATDNMTGTSGSIADLKGGTALTPFNTESGDLVAGP